METRGRTVGDLYRQAFDDKRAEPYDYQRRIAENGLPELLDVPTGCGKTPAMALGWLYRRRFHPDDTVRLQTPRRLLWCLPMRALVGQVAAMTRAWFGRTGCEDVGVYMLLGGEPTKAQEWRLAFDSDAVVIGTLDMLLSRALNRGYLASRFSWPIDFALFNNDCHWVFDEVQLMDVALGTSRQLHGLRARLGVAQPCGSTWMSATVDRDQLRTVDAPDLDHVVQIEDGEADAGLAQRLGAPKVLVRREVDDPTKYGRGFAEIVQAEQRPGTPTLAVLNTVNGARDVARELKKSSDREVVLLHSRYRPLDREKRLDQALEMFAEGRDGIVVSTQVIEAGVDLSAATLVTEAAPWSSLTQRAGRCNRWGELAEPGRMVVVRHAKPGPYELAHLDEAWATCGSFDGSVVSPQVLADQKLDERPPPHALLRRKDLLDLFDTAPDLSGNDVDVSRFIRLDDGLDLAVAWRPFPEESGPGEGDVGAGLPARDERCPVPLSEAREWLKGRADRVWIAADDANGTSRGRRTERKTWRQATMADLRPGAVLLAPCTLGGYQAEAGFDRLSKEQVPPVVADDAEHEVQLTDADLDMSDDPMSVGIGRIVTLTEHLGDVARHATRLCEALGEETTPEGAAVIRAGRLHDVGKAHPVWQKAVRALTDDPPVEPLAKSGRQGWLRYDPPYFRHELASALLLIAQPHLAESDPENPSQVLDPDLVTYLVGAHHGRVRLSVPAKAGEAEGTVLGVREGTSLRAVDLGAGGEQTPEVTLSLDVTRLGAGADGSRSWTARSLRLLGEYGPFRLAWLEMLVRIADWRASNEEAQP